MTSSELLHCNHGNVFQTTYRVSRQKHVNSYVFNIVIFILRLVAMVSIQRMKPGQNHGMNIPLVLADMSL